LRRLVLETASAPRASCTKHLLRVKRPPFRVGACASPLASAANVTMAKDEARPRKSSRAIRRRFKATARFGPCHFALSTEKEKQPGGQARCAVAISAAAAGEAWPVGPVSRFRSADGQLADRQALSGLTTGLIIVRWPGHRALVKSKRRGREFSVAPHPGPPQGRGRMRSDGGARRRSGLGVPARSSLGWRQVSDFAVSSLLVALFPGVPQFGGARRTRAWPWFMRSSVNVVGTLRVP